jgi:hypothetical protein
MKWDYNPPYQSLPVEMQRIAQLIHCDCKNLRPVTIAAKDTLAANTDAQTLLTYTVPANTTLVITRISGRFIPVPNDAALGAGDFRSGDVDAQGGALAFVKVNSTSRTGETTTYFALLNHEFFIAFGAGAIVTISIQRASATTPPTEVSLLALQGYLIPPQSLECITRAQGSIDEANPAAIAGTGIPSFWGLSIALPQASASASLTTTFSFGRLLTFPLTLPQAATFDRITIENTSANAAASLTVAIYNSSKVLVVQANTGALSATGKQTMSITTQNLTAGFYYVAVIEVGAQVNYRVLSTDIATLKIANNNTSKVVAGDAGAVVGATAPATFTTVTAPAYGTATSLKVPTVLFWTSTMV